MTYISLFFQRLGALAGRLRVLARKHFGWWWSESPSMTAGEGAGPFPHAPTDVIEVPAARYARSVPRTEYARIRDQIRLDYSRGVALWMPMPPNKKLNPQLRRMGGYFEDGTWGVPRGIVFATAPEREAAEGWLAQLPLPHVPALPSRPSAPPATATASVSEVRAAPAAAKVWVKEANEAPGTGATPAILARILEREGLDLGAVLQDAPPAEAAPAASLAEPAEPRKRRRAAGGGARKTRRSEIRDAI